jgi:hypothetical protein
MTFKAAGKEFLVYTWILKRTRDGEPPLRLTDEAAFDAAFTSLSDWVQRVAPGCAFASDLLTARSEVMDHRTAIRKGSNDNDLRDYLLHGWHQRHFAPHVSRLGVRIRTAFNEAGSTRSPDKYGLRTNNAVFECSVPPEKIHLHV